MSYQPKSAAAIRGAPQWGTVPPHPALTGQVVSYWWVRLVQGSHTIRALPDGCIDVTVDLSTPSKPKAYITGPQSAPKDWELSEGMFLFGARLLPPAASILTRGALHRLKPSFTSLGKFVGREAAKLARQVARGEDSASRAATLDAYFVRKLLAEPVDARLVKALDLAFESGGEISVEDLCKRSAASVRTLGRLFDRGVGLNPKRFLRIVRFQHLLRNLKGAPDWAALAAEVGYFDQAHLIREMRQLFGASPSEVVKTYGSLSG